MKLNAGMSSLDNHQRSFALWSSRSLIDRITVNTSDDALSAYKAGLQNLSSCPAEPSAQCESTSANSSPASCSVAELASYDIWSVFCHPESGLDAQLIEFNANLICSGACTANTNMTLQVSWVSKTADSDKRLANTYTTENGLTIASNQDFVVLDFQP